MESGKEGGGGEEARVCGAAVRVRVRAGRPVGEEGFVEWH